MAIAGFVSALASATPESERIAPPEKPTLSQSGMQPSIEDQGVSIPAGTLVEIAISEPISSKTNKIGDTFPLTLAAPLVIGERTVLPAGLSGRGEVIHAAKRGWGGKAGELIVNARYLECGDLRIPLGRFHYVNTGKSNVGGALVTAQIVPLGQFLVSGGDALIAAGLRGTAKIKTDTLIPIDATRRCAGTTE